MITSSSIARLRGAVKRPSHIQNRISYLLIAGQAAADESEELRDAGCIGMANQRLLAASVMYAELKELLGRWPR